MVAFDPLPIMVRYEVDPLHAVFDSGLRIAGQLFKFRVGHQNGKILRHDDGG